MKITKKGCLAGGLLFLLSCVGLCFLLPFLGMMAERSLGKGGKYPNASIGVYCLLFLLPFLLNAVIYFCLPYWNTIRENSRSIMKQGVLVCLLLLFFSCAGLHLSAPFLSLPWGMMRERSRQGYDKFYHETIISMWGGEPPASLHVIYAHETRETLDWSRMGDLVTPHFGPNFVSLRMKVDAADLLPWMEKQKFKTVIFHLPEYPKPQPGELSVDESLWNRFRKTGGKLKDAYCAFSIPYCFNASAVVESVTSPTLTLNVYCDGYLEQPSIRQRALDLTTESLQNEWYSRADRYNAMAENARSRNPKVAPDEAGKKSK